MDSKSSLWDILGGAFGPIQTLGKNVELLLPAYPTATPLFVCVTIGARRELGARIGLRSFEFLVWAARSSCWRSRGYSYIFAHTRAASWRQSLPLYPVCLLRHRGVYTPARELVPNADSIQVTCLEQIEFKIEAMAALAYV